MEYFAPSLPPTWKQVVSLGEAPPPSALGVKDKGGSSGIVAVEGQTNDEDVPVTEGVQGGRSEEYYAENRTAAFPGLKDFEHNFDREFVDSLCRQAGSDFFLYGTPHRNVSAAES